MMFLDIFSGTSFYILLITSTLLIVLLFFLFISYFKHRKELKKSLEKQAVKRNGSIKNRMLLFGYPLLRFYHNATEINVYSTPGSKYTPPYTNITCKLNTAFSDSMTIHKEGFSSKFGKKLGMQDITIGMDSFDREVIIKGSDKYFAKSILTYKVQDAVLNIVKKYNAKIFLGSNILTISIKKIIYDNIAYDDLIEAAIKIVDQIKEEKENNLR